MAPLIPAFPTHHRADELCGREIGFYVDLKIGPSFINNGQSPHGNLDQVFAPKPGL